MHARSLFTSTKFDTSVVTELELLQYFYIFKQFFKVSYHSTTLNVFSIGIYGDRFFWADSNLKKVLVIKRGEKEDAKVIGKYEANPVRLGVYEQVRNKGKVLWSQYKMPISMQRFFLKAFKRYHETCKAREKGVGSCQETSVEAYVIARKMIFLCQYN